VAILPGDKQAEASEGSLLLEYTPTAAERSQARTLITRQQLGGGSKWLTIVVGLFLIVGMPLALWFRIQAEIPKRQQPYWIAATAVVMVVAYQFVRRRNLRAVSGPAVKIELSASGLRFLGDQSHALVPWTALSPRMLESDTLFIVSDRAKTLSYIIPKRAFPTPESIDWFRAIPLGAGEAVGAAANPPIRGLSPESDEPAVAVIEYRFSFWNWVDRSLASWGIGSARGIASLWALLWLVVMISARFQPPPPNAKFNDWEVFCYFILPAWLVGSAILACFFTVYTWLAHRKMAVHQTVAIREPSVAVSSKDGSATLPWTTFTRYKETPWSFLVWNISPGNWLMLPKSAFPSLQALEDCRELLARQLRRSTWFFG